MDYIKKRLLIAVTLLSVIFIALSIAFLEILKSHHTVPFFRNTTLFFAVFIIFTLIVVDATYYVLMSELFRKIRLQNERIELINRLYRTLSRINRLIIVAENREELLKNACKVFVEDGGFEFAWAGIYTNGSIKPVACEGELDFARESEKVITSLLSSFETMPGERLKQGKIILIENVEEKGEPWVKNLLRLKFKSAAYIPISDNGTIKAVIGIYSDKPLLINDPEEERLLEEIKNDLSFAFDMITRLEYQRLLLNAFENSREMILIVDKNGKILFANPAVKDIMGYEASKLIGQKTEVCLPSVISKEDLDKFHQRVREGKPFSWLFVGRKETGETYHVEQFITPILSKNGEVTYYVLTGRDITTEKSLKEKLRELVYYDPVTSLPNKLFLEENVKPATEKAKIRGEKVALFFLDIWGFSEINSTFGFEKGDEILKEVGVRLKQAVGANNLVARIGGDEFGILIEGIKVEDEIRYWLSRIFDAFKEPVKIDEDEIYLDLNIGVAVYPNGTGGEDLISQADAALKNSKRDGAGNYKFFTEEMTQKMSKKLVIDNRLKEAVKNMDFILFYQPQVTLDTGKIIGFEALLRWSDEKLGWVSPAEFVPELEALGLIVDVGCWVLEKAAQDLKKFLQIDSDLRLSVNLSPYQLRKGVFVEKIINKLETIDVSPHHFAFEITESVLMSNIEEIRDELNILRDKGIKIDIDDFGTGYSSLSYLKKLPIDHLKIDRSFVIDIPGNKDSEAIIKAITTMAKELGLGLIAEGVETAEQLEFLRTIGVEHVQGYYFARPLPLVEALKLLKNNQESPFEV